MGEPRELPPIVSQVQAGILLREYRTRAGTTVEAAGDHIELSHATISRIESGKQSIRPDNAAALLTLYKVSDKERTDVMKAVRKTGNNDRTYRDTIPGWFARFYALESAATELWVYEIDVITGILQTEEYARAVLRAGTPHAPAHFIAEQLRLRLRRQEILRGSSPARLNVVLKEAALYSSVGNSAVMARQLDHLMAMSTLPNVDLRILPFNPDRRAEGDEAFSPRCAFTLLRLPELEDLVYLEDDAGATYPENRNVTSKYRAAYDRVRDIARNPADSRTMIKAMLDIYQAIQGNRLP